MFGEADKLQVGLAIGPQRDAAARREFYERTFGTLAAKVAGQLTTLGQTRGARVAVLAQNSAEYLALYAGILLTQFGDELYEIATHFHMLEALLK